MISTLRIRVFLALALAMVSTLLLTGCGGESYVGQWELDKEAFKAAVEAEMKKSEGGEGGENGMQAMGAAMMLGMIESMQMELDIKSDNTFAAKMSMGAFGEDTTTGTWKKDGNGIAMTASDGAEGPGKLVLKGGKLHAEPEKGSEEPPVVFKRKKS